MNKKHVPDWKLERYLLGGLPAKEQKTIAALERSDSGLRVRIDELRASNAAILAKYPPEVMLPKIENITVSGNGSGTNSDGGGDIGSGGIGSGIKTSQWAIPAFICGAVSVAAVAITLTINSSRNDAATGYGYGTTVYEEIVHEYEDHDKENEEEAEEASLSVSIDEGAAEMETEERIIRNKGARSQRKAVEEYEVGIEETESQYITVEEHEVEIDIEEETESLQKIVEEHEIGIEEAESITEHPQDTIVQSQPNKRNLSMGIFAGIGDDGRFAGEAYFRLELTKRVRGYMGLGYMFGSGENSLTGPLVTVDYEYKLDAPYFAGFLEWRAENGNFGVYGGPGVVLSYSTFDLTPVHNNEPIPLRISGPGVDLGVQGGAVWQPGPFIIGANARLTYGRHFWSEKENNAENKGVTDAIMFIFGVNVGFKF